MFKLSFVSGNHATTHAVSHHSNGDQSVQTSQMNPTGPAMLVGIQTIVAG